MNLTISSDQPLTAPQDFSQAALSAASRWSLYALAVFPTLALGGAPAWTVPVIEWLALLAAFCLGLRGILRGRAPWTPTALDRPFLALAVLCALSAALGMNFRASLSALTLLLAYGAVFYAAVDAVRSRDGLRALCYVIAGLGAFTALLGLFKYFGANPFPWWNYGGEQYSGRLASTYYNPDHLAGLMEMTLCLGAGLLLAGLSQAKRLAIALGCLAMSAALVLSLSRGGWAGALAGLGLMGAVLALRRHYRRGIVLVAAGAGFAALFLTLILSAPAVDRALSLEQGADMASWSSRVTVWKGACALIADRPFTGAGPGNFALAFDQFQPKGLGARFDFAHNDYLHFVAELGLPLVPVILWTLLALARQARRKLDDHSRLVRGTALGALAGIVALLVHSAGDFNLHLPANALVFTLLAAVLFAPAPREKKRRSMA